MSALSMRRTTASRAKSERRRFDRIALLLATSCAGLLVLTACTFDATTTSPTSPSETPSSRATQSPVATVQPTAKPQRVPQGLVASGTFRSTDGSTTGAVDVVVKQHLAELVLRDLVSTHERLGVRAPLRDSRADPCMDGHAFAFTSIIGGTPTDPLIMPLSLGRGDPSFIREIALTILTQADGSSHCLNLVVARAPLVWTFGPLRPYLDTLVDGGIRGGARGEVGIDATGRPLAYTVAPNDLLPEVAGRFGITLDDVFYLNPTRGGSYENPMLYVEEVLNLDLRDR